MAQDAQGVAIVYQAKTRLLGLYQRTQFLPTWSYNRFCRVINVINTFTTNGLKDIPDSDTYHDCITSLSESLAEVKNTCDCQDCDTPYTRYGALQALEPMISNLDSCTNKWAAEDSIQIVTATASGEGTGTVKSNVGGINFTYTTATNTGSTTPINGGTRVILTAAGTNGSTASWTDCKAKGGTPAGDGTVTATCTINSISADMAVMFFTSAQIYRVTATASGTGTGTVVSNVGGISYTYSPTTTTGAITSTPLHGGTNVVLTATGTNSSTVEWTVCGANGGTAAGNGTGTATCTINSISAEKTMGVVFTLGN